METMNAFDIGQILAVIALFYKLSSDRAHHAEDMGRIKSQIEHLESRASTVDTRLRHYRCKVRKADEFTCQSGSNTKQASGIAK